MRDKVCFQCAHFYFSLGEPDLSEVTPGEAPHFECNKRHFDHEYDMGTEEAWNEVQRAKVCADFESADWDKGHSKVLPLPEDPPPALVCVWCEGVIDRNREPFIIDKHGAYHSECDAATEKIGGVN
jgi:hypothetical protein